MKIGLMGAGKAGISMALYLKSKGHIISGIYSKTAASAERAGKLIHAPVFADIGDFLSSAQCVMMAVPDDVIPLMAQKIAEENFPVRGKTFFHLSGALSSDVLVPLKALGAFTFSVHPPYSFAEVLTNPAVLDSVTFTAEGEGDLMVIDRLFPRIRYIDPSQKPLYHLALCMMSNYFVTLMDHAAIVLEDISLDIKDFLPLLTGTLENIVNNGTKEALTGPIARGDTGTLQTHLEHLSNVPLKEFYTQMGIYTSYLAFEANKIDLSTLKKIQEVLSHG